LGSAAGRRFDESAPDQGNAGAAPRIGRNPAPLLGFCISIQIFVRPKCSAAHRSGAPHWCNRLIHIDIAQFPAPSVSNAADEYPLAVPEAVPSRRPPSADPDDVGSYSRVRSTPARSGRLKPPAGTTKGLANCARPQDRSASGITNQ
jgi:hypothetical protein